MRSNSSPPEQNGVGMGGMENGEEEEEAGREKEESGGSGEGRGAEENETAAGEPQNQNEVPKQAEMYGSYIDPVPVLIVGSHYDQFEGQGAATEAVQQTQQLVVELRQQFEEYLSISPRLYPLNCISAVSKEIKDLKERLCEVRSELVEVRSSTPVAASPVFWIFLFLVTVTASISTSDGESGTSDRVTQSRANTHQGRHIFPLFKSLN